MQTSDKTIFYCDYTLQDGWANRLIFRGSRGISASDGHFSGRVDQVDQLTKFFLYGSGGTVLVSGHRGVGKTATVDKALVEGLHEIERDAEIRRTNLSSAKRDPRATVALQRGKPPPKKLIVLKLDFGQIAKRDTPTPPVPPPGDTKDETKSDSAKTTIDARQVLIEIIKGLHQQLVVDRHPTAAERRAWWDWAYLSSLATMADIPARQGPTQPSPNPATVTTPGGVFAAESQIPKPRWRDRWRQDQFFRQRRFLKEYVARALLQRLGHRHFWRDVTTLLNQSMVRAYSQSYRQEFTTGSSIEVQNQQTRNLSVDLKKLLLTSGLLAALFTLVGLNLGPTANLPAYILAALGAVGLNAAWSLKRTELKTDAVKLVYGRDASLASLKRDVEEIFNLLHDERAPHDFRIVVILDELDKLEDDTMLDNVIQSFKNLFTLNRVVFVFLTDVRYFDHLEAERERFAKMNSYAPQHTFFTIKVFLPRSDFAEIRAYLDSVRVDKLDTSEQQQQWDLLVRHLTFVSKCHFFDLIGLLNELVKTSQDRIPRLRLTDERLSQRDFRRRANFQRMIELVYADERYPSHLEDHLNNRLLAELYKLFDNLDFDSFTAESNGTNGDVSEEDARIAHARNQLLHLLLRTEAIAPDRSNGSNGSVRYVWSQDVGREPVREMMALDKRRAQLIADIELQLKRWSSVEGLN